MSEAQSKTEVTTELVVQKYRELGMAVWRGTTSLAHRGIGDDGEVNVSEPWQFRVSEAGCCALGVILVGRSARDYRTACEELGIDYFGFTHGFDGQPLPSPNVADDVLQSYELGKACYAACVEAKLPGTV